MDKPISVPSATETPIRPEEWCSLRGAVFVGDVVVIVRVTE